MKISAKKELSFLKEILKKLGVNKEQSEIVATVCLDADLKGFSSHGIGRFSQYIKSVQNGFIKTEGDIEIVKETESIGVINGNSIFGHVVAYKAMELAIKKAKKTGIGAVGTHNGNHFGATGFYSDLAIKNGLIGIAIANTEPAIAPLGGKKALIGTNPIAIGIPGSEYIATDMATSASARGKLLEAKRKGEKIPPNVALDSDGKPTTDPEEALKGSILSFGAHKGYGLAFMIELLTGPLVGACYGTGVTGTANPEMDCTKGDLFVAIDPDAFVGKEYFKEHVDNFIKEVRDAGNGFVPGDIEVKKIKNAKENGISLDDKLFEQLSEVCEHLDIDINKYIEK